MKTNFLIVAGIMCVAAIPPASAVTKCVKLSSSISCNQFGGAGPEWTADCTVNGTSVPLRGVVGCSSTKGSSKYATATTLPISYSADKNLNCWCKLVSPAVSRWVYVSSATSTESCATYCSGWCADEIFSSNKASFFSALFRNLSD